MSELIVYNTPYPCANNCTGCYLKKVHDLGDLKVMDGVKNLNTILSKEKRATLVIAINNNTAAYEHAEWILKKTKVLRKYRETHILTNIEGCRVANLIRIISENGIDELTFSTTIEKLPYCRAVMGSIKGDTKKKFKTSVIITLDKQDPAKLHEQMIPKNGEFWIDEIHVLPIIDKEEVTTLVRTQRFLPDLIKIIEDGDVPLHITSCISCFANERCPAVDNGYIEITGKDIIEGCPYKLYTQCKRSIV